MALPPPQVTHVDGIMDKGKSFQSNLRKNVKSTSFLGFEKVFPGVFFSNQYKSLTLLYSGTLEGTFFLIWVQRLEI